MKAALLVKPGAVVLGSFHRSIHGMRPCASARPGTRGSQVPPPTPDCTAICPVCQCGFHHARAARAESHSRHQKLALAPGARRLWPMGRCSPHRPSSTARLVATRTSNEPPRADWLPLLVGWSLRSAERPVATDRHTAGRSHRLTHRAPKYYGSRIRRARSCVVRTEKITKQLYRCTRGLCRCESCRKQPVQLAGNLLDSAIIPYASRGKQLAGCRTQYDVATKGMQGARDQTFYCYHILSF